MKHDTTINNLRLCDAIDALELYCVESDQRVPIIHFRIWDALKCLTSDDAKSLVKEFNDSTWEVRNKWLRKYRDAAARDLLGGRDLTK